MHSLRPLSDFHKSCDFLAIGHTDGILQALENNTALQKANREENTAVQKANHIAAQNKTNEILNKMAISQKTQ